MSGRGGQHTAYVDLAITMRPPRVAIIIDGGDHWTYWARRALHLANQVWGGGDFAVVPHHAGLVHPVLLRGVRAYDPDYVIALDQRPFEVALIDGRDDPRKRLPAGVDESVRAVLEADARRPVPDAATERARDVVFNVCSAYRQRIDGQTWQPPIATLPSPGDPGSLTPDHLPDHRDGGPRLRCPAAWTGPLAVAVASRAGSLDDPEPSFQAQDLAPSAIDRLGAWLLGDPIGDLPDALVHWPSVGLSMPTAHLPLAFDETLQGLVPVQEANGYGAVGLLVTGGSCDDFALARLWQLLFGCGSWLPPEVPLTGDSTWRTKRALGA